jgi:4-amino-4-deoxy-L-arabinose transferase-like glycosyltransferase
LPVALLSLAFLAGMLELLRREFGIEAAAIATALLATSAGWLAYSSFALTDVPLAVFFSTAVFLGLPLLRAKPDTQHIDLRFALIGAALGLATLAKGLVPLVLAAPLVWFLRAFWRKYWIAAAACAIIALPWYVLVYLRNGKVFLLEFFWKHHFERLYSATLQHVQPWYYYVPILLAALFPWSPLFGVVVLRPRTSDRRRTCLSVIVGFGFLFFSASLNKLPGYLLPLLPSAFVLLGASFEFRRTAEFSRWWFAACGALVGLLPLVARFLPQSLESGKLTVGSLGHFTATQWAYVLAPVVVAAVARRTWIIPVLVIMFVFGGMLLKITAYPSLDRDVSPRVFWRSIQTRSGEVCDGGLDRHWDYGIAFYRGAPLPPCTSGSYKFELLSRGHGIPVLAPLSH